MAVVHLRGGDHRARCHVADHRRDRVVVDELLGDLRGRGAIGLVVGVLQLELVTPHASGVVDLLDRKVDSEARILAVAQLPRPRGRDRVRRARRPARGACGGAQGEKCKLEFHRRPGHFGMCIAGALRGTDLQSRRATLISLSGITGPHVSLSQPFTPSQPPMDERELHLVLNPFPVILSVMALLASLVAVAKQSRAAWLYAAASLTIAGLFSYPTFLTGHGAHEVLEDLW